MVRRIEILSTHEYEYARERVGEVVKVAAVQMEPRMDEDGTLKKICEHLKSAAEKGALLVVFPELSLTGLMKTAAETIPGPSTETLAIEARKFGVYVVVGLLERYKEKIYNTAVLLGPTGIVGKYRKVHPWYPTEYEVPVEPGDLGYPVFATGIGRVGMLICYDAWFPEPSRVLALKGAEIIALPTRTGLHSASDHILRTRALENHVWIVGANVTGTFEEKEVAWTYVGRSQIVSVFGEVLAEAREGEEETIYATIDVKAATLNKQLLPGSEWKKSDLFWARKPQTYKTIARPHSEENRPEM